MRAAGRHDLEGRVPEPGNRDGLLLVRRRSLRQRRSADGGGGEGFSNVGDVLFTSPQQLDKYFNAARKLTDSGRSESTCPSPRRNARRRSRIMILRASMLTARRPSPSGLTPASNTQGRLVLSDHWPPITNH